MIERFTYSKDRSTMSRSGIASLSLLAAVLVAVGMLARPSECARAFFVFGDSLVDNGNNNYLMTTARADSPPYGIDYPTHRPTGRFSNGKNIPDIISTAGRFPLSLSLVCGAATYARANDPMHLSCMQASTSAPSPRCRT